MLLLIWPRPALLSLSEIWHRRDKPCTECGSLWSKYWRTSTRCSWECERVWLRRECPPERNEIVSVAATTDVLQHAPVKMPLSAFVQPPWVDLEDTGGLVGGRVDLPGI